MPDDEATPIMHPVRMELAPHARLGRRMAASTAIFVLLVFHVSMVTIGVLNMNSNCAERLWLFLVIYGGVGLLFVYLLFREWLYYARLSSLPTLANLLLLIIFYALLSTAGGLLTYYTVMTRDSCSTTAPLLYRWCEAAVIFFAILTVRARIPSTLHHFYSLHLTLPRFQQTGPLPLHPDHTRPRPTDLRAVCPLLNLVRRDRRRRC